MATTFSVGDVVCVGCARVRIDSIINGTQYNVTYLAGDLEEYVVPNDPDNRVQIIPPEDWDYVTPTATVGGLNHLEGKQVYALADGEVRGPLTVSGAEVTLPVAAANVLVGLQYTQQIKTLYLTVDGLQPGTIQGKRKFVPAVTLRVDCTRGLSAGIDFDNLTPVPDLNDIYDPYTGDARVVVFSDWTETGEVCVEQTQPLPAGVLGIIVEVTPGDTGR